MIPSLLRLTVTRHTWSTSLFLARQYSAATPDLKKPSPPPKAIDIFRNDMLKNSSNPDIDQNTSSHYMELLFNALPDEKRFAYDIQSRLLSGQYERELKIYKQHLLVHQLNLNFGELNLPEPAPAPPERTVSWTALALQNYHQRNPQAGRMPLSEILGSFSAHEIQAFHEMTKALATQYAIGANAYKQSYTAAQVAMHHVLALCEKVIDSFDSLVDLSMGRVREKKSPATYIWASTEAKLDSVSSPGWQLFFKEFVASATDPVDPLEIVESAAQAWGSLDLDQKLSYITKAENLLMQSTE